MSTPLSRLLLSGLTLFGLPAGATVTQKFQVKPFEVNLSERVPHMLDLIRDTQLPSSDFVGAVDSLNGTLSTGIPLQTLKNLRNQWINDFNWDEEQASINKYGNNIPSTHFADCEAYFQQVASLHSQH